MHQPHGVWPTGVREPFADFGISVSSASTMPDKSEGHLSSAVARKR